MLPHNEMIIPTLSEFSASIKEWVLESEGGYVNHPNDPGGPTNMGITQRTLAEWRGTSVSENEVRNLDREEALEIYKANYWDPIQGSKLPNGLNYAVLDYAINSGVSRAVKDLQRTLGFDDPDVDGIVGVQTLNAIWSYPNQEALIHAYFIRRWDFMKRLRTFATFGAGWKRRLWGNVDGVQAGGREGADTGAIDRAIQLLRGAAKPPESFPAPVPKPLEDDRSQGRAEPEAPPVIDILKHKEVITTILSMISTILTYIADRPILQYGLIAVTLVLLIGLLFIYINNQKKQDPT